MCIYIIYIYIYISVNIYYVNMLLQYYILVEKLDYESTYYWLVYRNSITYPTYTHNLVCAKHYTAMGSCRVMLDNALYD